MSTLATQRHTDDLQTAYSYSLSHLSNLGERCALKLKKRFPTHQSWFQLSPSERQEATKTTLGSDPPTVITTNFDALIERALTDIKHHEREGIQIVSIDDTGYPKLLKLIDDPPLVLFVKGSMDALSANSNVAVVGTRDATSAGERVAFKIAKWLGEHSWCVVSGLAKGIDTAAHKGTLDGKFPTAAVMATPLNKIYPKENRKLADEILDHGGCWISEFPLWKKPYRSAFVQRNRIQSGLSVAVIPVQTDIEGGTMHTVRFAEQQHRLLLCPRPIQPEQSLRQYAGIRQLIESDRAVPFSGEEYGRVLEFLRDRRAKLLNTPLDNNPIIHLSGVVPLGADGATEQKSAEGPMQTKPPRKSRRRLQAGFPFIEDGSNKNPRKPSAKEMELRVKVLEELRDEILDAKRLDGTRLSDPADVKAWLEEKIRILRAKTDKS